MQRTGTILEESATLAMLDTDSAYGDDILDPAPPLDVEAILTQLSSPQVSERMQAARQFSEVVEPRAIPCLIHLLADACPLVRISAVYALGRNPDPQAVEPLVLCLEDFNDYVRKGAVWALGNCQDLRALHPLIASLCFDVAAVRLWSASALGQLGDREAVSFLIAALQGDPDAAVRANCAWALSRIGDPSAREPLRRGLSDPDLGVQQDCAAALAHLGWGVDLDSY